MCCVFTVLLFFGPRLAILMWWLFDKFRFQDTFGTFIWPLLGFIFLPWTTLMYVIVYPNGFSTLNWVFLGLALLADIASYAGGGYGNRDRLRG
jgi:hypothetical protein